MGLNVSKGNMYEFVTHTWNTVKGVCPHGCAYCYVKSGCQKPIRFDYSEITTDMERGHFIFVGSGNDLFANDIPKKWIDTTIDHCTKFSNWYLFQSKNPARFAEFELPQKSVICTTIETNRWYPEIMNNSPAPQKRAEAMEIAYKGYPTFVTIEPIIDFDLEELVTLIRMCNPKQVNIGADSKGCNLPEPDRVKIFALINELQGFTRIEKKDNLWRLLR